MAKKHHFKINDKSIAVIQARMKSTRYPGKVMFPFSGKPAMEHILDSALQVFDPPRVYVVTSVDPANDAIVALCKQKAVNVYRGDEDNVASRFWDILHAVPCDYFVRLNADSPLLDHRIIIRAADIATSSGDAADIVSTSSPRNFPSGMNVEIVRSRTFLNEYSYFSDTEHFEHVTLYFYQNLHKFVIKSVPSKLEKPQSYKFSFDTDEDRKRMEAIFESLSMPHYKYTLRQKCRIYDGLFGGKNC